LKVYLEPPPVKSPSLRRVEAALKQYAPPEVHVVDRVGEADLVVLHVIGRCEQIHNEARDLMVAGKKYAVIQYCLRSTQKPRTQDWRSLWKNSRLVWSYYNLDALAAEDGENRERTWEFYHAPLGAHGSVFFDRLSLNGSRPYLSMTHGQSWLTEGVREVAWATRLVGKKAFHLGGPIHRGMDIDCQQDISDDQLASVMSQVRYVCPLRRTEGFELPAVEGLFCGARPVLYNRPHYQQWYGDLAEYIEELPRQQVIDQLVALFQQPYRRVRPEEIQVAHERFSWPKIIKGFWERALA
jgi:hypothetical protein